jgi:uncharacterized protein
MGSVPKVVIDTSDIYTEVQRVVAYPKLKFSHSLQVKILEFILSWSKFISPKENVRVIVDDPDDDKILSCAVGCHASAIVSGDPHLLRLQSYRGIPVLTPTEFLERRVVASR